MGFDNVCLVNLLVGIKVSNWIATGDIKRSQRNETKRGLKKHLIPLCRDELLWSIKNTTIHDPKLRKAIAALGLRGGTKDE